MVGCEVEAVKWKANCIFQMFIFGKGERLCNNSSSPHAVMWDLSLRVQLTVWVEGESSSGKPISHLEIAGMIEIEFTRSVVPRTPMQKSLSPRPESWLKVMAQNQVLSQGMVLMP